ncbi:ML domain-containing protein [Phthorimaea operculella]|nr:ML domain-containing protein [Phthorimaea operculella]
MKVLALLLFVVAASADVFNTKYCPGSDLSKCEINEIRIDPCEGGKTCKIQRGTDAHISFDLTPHFSASSLNTTAVYQGTHYAGFEPDGCKQTKCPTEPGVQQTYNATLHIGKKLPKGTYEFEWALFDATNEQNRCCFVLKVKLLNEYLIKKLCDDADYSQCSVHNVVLDPCSKGGSFCTIKRTKRYTLSMDFLPKFSADRLELAMYADEENTGTFNEIVKTPADACDMLTCPIDAETRRIFDIDFSLGKTFSIGKYPIKVKLFNKDDDKQGCCFTFNVKVNK